jgi:pyruvate dehydrogenase E1 component alpha subunit
MGKSDGLCDGMGGHMHLFSREHLAMSDGIVGASGPAAVGFAIANQRLRPRSISVAFFGEGAVNEGMLMESFNLASVWKLPVMFVAKDNGQAVWTQSSDVTGGNLLDRAKGFGLRARDVDGRDVNEVWNIAHEEITRLRNGDGSVFIHACCFHLEGHFLGDALLRFTHPSLRDTLKTTVPMLKALIQPKGAPLSERLAALQELQGNIGETVRKYRTQEGDPIPPLRKKLFSIDSTKLVGIEEQLRREIEIIVLQASETPIERGG